MFDQAVSEHTASDQSASDRLEVEVIRSRKRRKTIQASEVNGKLRIAIPESLSTAEERHWVETMTNRFTRRKRPMASDDELQKRATTLAQRYGLPVPRGIRWVGNRSTQWASCTTTTGSIRVSERLRDFPVWVLDYVLVHEIAHLVVPAHNARFWNLVKQYPRAERARGFLLAKDAEEI